MKNNTTTIQLTDKVKKRKKTTWSKPKVVYLGSANTKIKDWSTTKEGIWDSGVNHGIAGGATSSTTTKSTSSSPCGTLCGPS